MPSPHQHASSQTYEPTELAAEYGEDPARFLDCNPDLALARIRGIDDPALLAAYIRVEVERQRRKPVIAAINQRLAEIDDGNAE